MPKWVKWTLLWAWVAGGVTFTILTEYDDDFEERSVDSARMTVTVRPGEDGDELAPLGEMRIEAEIAERGELLRMVFEDGDVRGANPSAPEAEMVLEGRRDLYLHFLTEKPRLPPGKAWIGLDVDQVQRVAPEFAGVLGFVQADGILSSKPPPPDDLETGTETIAGVETTRYELSADADELDGIPSIPAEALVGDDLQMTMWLDPDGFVRRLVIPISASSLRPRAGEGTVELHYEIYDLGADVTIEVPDDQDVISG